VVSKCSRGFELYFRLLYQEKWNKIYSKKLLAQIKRIVSFVRDNNYLGKATEEGNTRVLIYKNYKIFYEITEDKIKIKLIWDSRRNPEDLEI
jgi:hypothetical protein